MRDDLMKACAEVRVLDAIRSLNVRDGVRQHGQKDDPGMEGAVMLEAVEQRERDSLWVTRQVDGVASAGETLRTEPPLSEPRPSGSGKK